MILLGKSRSLQDGLNFPRNVNTHDDKGLASISAAAAAHLFEFREGVRAKNSIESKASL